MVKEFHNLFKAQEKLSKMLININARWSMFANRDFTDKEFEQLLNDGKHFILEVNNILVNSD